MTSYEVHFNSWKNVWEVRNAKSGNVISQYKTREAAEHALVILVSSEERAAAASGCLLAFMAAVAVGLCAAIHGTFRELPA
jgi:macrodomain Ter protein organizer (MatP/YcbG family)